MSHAQKGSFLVHDRAEVTTAVPGNAGAPAPSRDDDGGEVKDEAFSLDAHGSSANGGETELASAHPAGTSGAKFLASTSAAGKPSAFSLPTGERQSSPRRKCGASLGVKPVELRCKDLTYSVALPQEGNCLAVWRRMCWSCCKTSSSQSSAALETAQKPRKKILCLDGLEVVFSPGDCVALMGSSGAGKSTLLNCLSSRVSAGLSGEVTLSGVPCTRQLCKNLCSFVQQEDLLFGYLTVEEHLLFQARLRLPRGTPAEEAKRITQCLLETFGLANISNSFVGGLHENARGSISGGEKKRLCVASELLSNPSVIFADEPTSGLDSFMAKAVCDQLSALAAAGCTVVCTIHQPSSSCFELFNKVLLLGEGLLLYYGDRLAAVVWLEHLGCKRCGVDSNPAEFILTATALQDLDPQTKSKRLKEWADVWKLKGQEFLYNWENKGRAHFKQRSSTFSSILRPMRSASRTVSVDVSEQEKESPSVRESESQKSNEDAEMVDLAHGSNRGNDSSNNSPASQRAIHALSSIGAARKGNRERRISAFTEALVLTKRGLLLRWRDPSTSYIRLAATLITALFPSFIFFQMGWSLSDAWNRVSACYQIILTQALSCLFAVAHLFPQARPVAQREFESGVIRMWVYFIGASTSDTALFLVFPIIFHTITFWIMGLADTAAKFFASLCVLLLGVLSLQSYGYLISAAVSDEVVALAVTQVTQVILSLFSGFMARIDELGTFWRILAALSPFKYALAAFSLTILKNEYFIDNAGELLSADEFLEVTFGIKRDSFYSSLGALAGLIIVPRLLALCIMEFQARRRRENA